MELPVTEDDARNWLERVWIAAGDDGSNDEEHDLLMEAADLLATKLGLTAPDYY